MKYWPGRWTLARSTPGFPGNGHKSCLGEVLKGENIRLLYFQTGPIRGKDTSWHISCLRPPDLRPIRGQPTSYYISCPWASWMQWLQWIKHFQCNWVKVGSEIINNNLQHLTSVLTHATMYHLLWLTKTTKRELDKIHPHEWAFQTSHQMYLIANH